MAHNRRWTEGELEYLLDNWGLLPDGTVARKLGRSVTACQLKAKRRRVNRKMAFWTAQDVARLFRVDGHVVLRWIRHGLLPRRRAPFKFGPNRPWIVTYKSLERFLRQYPYHYDWRRMESGPERDLARRACEEDPYLRPNEAAARLGVHLETIRRHLRRGRLSGVKTWEAGLHGGWRIRSSALADFRLRRTDHVAEQQAA